VRIQSLVSSFSVSIGNSGQPALNCLESFIGCREANSCESILIRIFAMVHLEYSDLVAIRPLLMQIERRFFEWNLSMNGQIGRRVKFRLSTLLWSNIHEKGPFEIGGLLRILITSAGG
jgi:hypothetical protein